MAGMRQTMAGCVVLGVLAAIMGAPLEKANLDSIKAALKSQLQEQEMALEALNPQGTDGLQMTKSQSFSYSNINGAESKSQSAEETVSEPETQHLISDVAEEFKSKQQTAADKPVTSYKASVDIPDEGIHKAVSTDDVDSQEAQSEEQLNPEDSEEGPVEFSPRSVAEYLIKTGETDEFQALLNDLVEASEITSEEAEQYEMAVMNELYQMEQQQQGILPPANNFYPSGYESSEQGFPYYDRVSAGQDVYPLYGYGENVALKAPEEENNYINYLLNQPVSLDEMINQLLNQWLNNAINTGDPEAEEVLTNIVDFVAQDDNPNNEAQVKEILGDIFAEALLEDLTPRVEPQELQMPIVSPHFPQVPELMTSEENDNVVGDVDSTEEELKEEAAIQEPTDSDALKELKAKM